MYHNRISVSQMIIYICICFPCHTPVLLSSFYDWSNIFLQKWHPSANSGAGSAYQSGAHEFTPGFSRVSVSQSLVVTQNSCVVLSTIFLSFWFGHCIVCPSSIVASDHPFGVFNFFFTHNVIDWFWFLVF